MSQNNVNLLLDQQYGFSRWRSCDTAIKRLRCTRPNTFTQMFSTSPLEDELLARDTPIFACKFAPQKGSEQFIALANEDGKLAIHDTDNPSARYGVEAHNNAIFDLAWAFDQMHIVTASGDHTLKMFDAGNGTISQNQVFFGHTRSVKTVAFQKNSSTVFASGGRDGNVIVWDSRCPNTQVGQPDVKITNSHNARYQTPSKNVRRRSGTPHKSTGMIHCSPSSGNCNVKSVTGLVFPDENTLISCGAGDGLIKIWDLRKTYNIKKDAIPKYCILHAGVTAKNGFSSLVLDQNSIRLYASCLDNVIYCYNIANFNPVPEMLYTGHQNNTFYIKSALSHDGNYLVSGSSDENAYIWNINRSSPIVKLTGHNAEVTCVSWIANHKKTLITCSDDMTHKIWEIGEEELPEDWPYIGSGKAEVLPLIKNPNRPSLKRLAELENYYTPKKFAIACERCKNATNGIRFCENCNTSTKRKTTSELCNENKRASTEFGPRRLFTTLHNNMQELAQIIEESHENFMENDKNKNKDSQQNENVKDSEETEKTTAVNEKIVEKVTIRQIENLNKTELNLKSPTLNLPNFVIDGIAPHLNYSPPKKRRQDWLTKLRIERNLRMEMQEKSGPPSPKMPKLDLTPRSNKRCASPNLLHFFKVTTNANNKCDGIGCCKSQCGGSSSNFNCPNVNTVTEQAASQ